MTCLERRGLCRLDILGGRITTEPFRDEESVLMKRQTRQRTEILRVIADARRPLSPMEILEAGRRTISTLSLATVYRSLRDLQRDGMIHAVALPGENCRYETRHAHAHHHHHFQCDRCQRVFDIQGCPAGLVGMQIPVGFQVKRHEVTLYGICAECGLMMTEGETELPPQ